MPYILLIPKPHHQPVHLLLYLTHCIIHPVGLFPASSSYQSLLSFICIHFSLIHQAYGPKRKENAEDKNGLSVERFVQHHKKDSFRVSTVGISIFLMVCWILYLCNSPRNFRVQGTHNDSHKKVRLLERVDNIRGIIVEEQ